MYSNSRKFEEAEDFLYWLLRKKIFINLSANFIAVKKWKLDARLLRNFK
jgi:hypothetical protein